MVLVNLINLKVFGHVHCLLGWVSWPHCGGVHQSWREVGVGLPVFTRISLLLSLLCNVCWYHDMFGKIPGSAPARPRGIGIRMVRPVAECGRGLVYYSSEVWTHHLKQCRIAATTGWVQADIQIWHPPPRSIQYWQCATFRIPWHAFFITFLWFFSSYYLLFLLVFSCPLSSSHRLSFISISVIFFHFLPVFFLTTQMNVFIVLFVTIENTNTPKALLPEVNICHHFLELLQTFSQLLRQQTDFGVFSSNV